MSIKFKAGKYYIGDLCYVIPDNEWSKVCDLIFPSEKPVYGFHPWKTGKLWDHGTAYGDGSYTDQEGHEYGVDSGGIGCIPIEYCDESVKRMNTLGRIVEFDKPFTCDYENGVFYIGHIVINTEDEEEEEDEEDWDEDEDDDEPF